MRILVLLLAFVLSSSQASAAWIRDIAVPDPWTGGAYSDDTNGGFSHCAASVEYLSEVLMVVSLDRDYVWGIGFANSSWSLQMDVDIPVQYRFGNGRWQSVNGYAVATDHLIVPMPQTEQAVDIFRRASLLELSFGEGDYQFDLTGTSRVTADVFGCVADHLDGTMSVPPPTETVAATPEPETTAAPEAQPEAPSGPSSGTGVLISTSGHILTNHHVIDGCSTVTVTRGSEVAAPAQVLRIDQQNDLAVLTTDKTFPASDVATFRVGNPVKPGETVAIYGFPLAGLLSTTGNITAGNITSLTGVSDDARFFQISAPVQPGNSGGPLLDGSGLLIGIVNARIDDATVMNSTGTVPQNVNFAIRANIATNFLEAQGIPYLTESTPPPAMSLVDIADAARKFGVFVLCE